METKMQTSFIPKKPIVESRPEGGGISLFLLLAIIIFIVSLALVGGVWLWHNRLTVQIEKDKEALVAAKDSYEEDTINPLIRLDDRINETKGLLERHLAVSPVFTLLEKNVLRNVRLKTMKFSYDSSNKIKIELTGSAASYEALSKQADAFGEENLRKYLSEPVISDFSPTADGRVSFSFTASIDSRLISYEETLTDESATPAPVETESDNSVFTQ